VIIYVIVIVQLVVTMLDMVPIHHHQQHVMLKIVLMDVSVLFHHALAVRRGGELDSLLTVRNIFSNFSYRSCRNTATGLTVPLISLIIGLTATTIKKFI
jgi:hypothetical protein